MRAKDIAIILTCLHLISLSQGEDVVNWGENNDQKPSSRILFGNAANPRDFPFFVGVHYGRNLCAGSIIANAWVMTAAHCVSGAQCNMIRIKPGTWQNGNSINPIQCVTHPRYSRGFFAYDIAILRVREGILNDGLTRSIPLPRPGTYYRQGTPATIIGYGQTERGNYPQILLRANVMVDDWNSCNAKFLGRPDCVSNPYCRGSGIPNRVLCTQGMGPAPSGTCFGDSGGPVIADGCVVGICSFVMTDGRENCRIGTPSMHVSVVDYIPWMMSIMAPEMDMSGVQVRPEF